MIWSNNGLFFFLFVEYITGREVVKLEGLSSIMEEEGEQEPEEEQLLGKGWGLEASG